MPFFRLFKNCKFYILLFFIIISIILFSFLYTHSKQDFQEITNSIFFEDILTDTLSLHFTLANPAKYSIQSYPLTLPKYNKDSLIQANSKIENLITFLNNYDSSSLSEEDAYCYNLLLDYFSMAYKGIVFSSFDECFSPSSGIPANFPILMSEYTFRNQTDITDYLTLLKDTPNYFQSYFSFQKGRAKIGHTLATTSLLDTVQQCDTIITKDALHNNSHFLQITFRERLAPLVAKDIITKEEALQYININNMILEKQVLPAYITLKNNLLSLQSQSGLLQGLYRKDNGKNYYQWLAQKQIGCSLSISDILKKLESDYNNNLLEFSRLQQKIYSNDNYKQLLNADFPIKNRDDCFNILQSYIQNDFPSLKNFSSTPVMTTIKTVTKSMEEYLSPAFYLVPPIDDFTQNTIYINESSTPNGLELFTTLAHEGFPGHLYQTVYYQLYAKKNNVPYIRHSLNFNGYVEGWAIYSEFYAYNYATYLYPTESQSFYDLWHRLLVCDRKLQLAILSILDIKLHYFDDSYETAKTLLNNYGIHDKKTIDDIYQYILEEPCNYLKYYVGYLLLMEIKEKAKTLMGSDFSDLKFHEFILNSGPSDFDNLEYLLIKKFSHSYNTALSSSIMDSK